MITSTNRNRRRKCQWSFPDSSSSEEEDDFEQQKLEEQIKKKEANREELNTALEKYWDHIKPPDKRAFEKHEVEEIVQEILNRIESKDPRFKMEMSFRGSTYENINLSCAEKSSEDRDFEWHCLAYYVMLSLTQLAIEKEFQQAGEQAGPGERAGEQADSFLCPHEFTKYPLKSEVAETWKDLADSDGKLLDPEKVLETFNTLISESIKELDGSKKYDNLTLNACIYDLAIQNAPFSKKLCVVKFTPVIELKKWPETIAIGWESRKKQALPADQLVAKVHQNSIYLVPTQNCWYDKEADLLWRYTFTQSVAELFAERESALTNSCTTEVIGIFRGLLNDIPYMKKWFKLLKPWHMNSILLYEFEEHPETEQWQRTKLGERVLSVMTRLKNCLQEENCMDYFIKDKNLMSSAEMREREYTKVKIADILRDANKFLEDPIKLVTGLIEDYEFREACKKILPPIEDFLHHPMSILRNSMGIEPSLGIEKVNSKEKKKVASKNPTTKSKSTGKGIQEQSQSSNEERSVFTIPNEFITQIEDLLDNSDEKRWRFRCKHSKEKEGGVDYFHDMLSILGEEYRLLESETQNKLQKMRSQLKHIPGIFKAIIWDGEDVQQFNKKCLELNCNIDQETFDLISKSLPYYGSIIVEGSLEFNCTESMLNQIEIASKKKAICIKYLNITAGAVLSEGAFRYFAHLIPFVKSVHIKTQGIPKSVGDTLMSVCKSLDFDVRTKDFSFISCDKQDMGNLVKFFPFVEKVALHFVNFTLETMALFATAAAETFDRETKEGRQLSLKFLSLFCCIFDPRGVGWELMKVSCFVEKVHINGSQVSCKDLKEMARYITELRKRVNGEVTLKKLSWGCGFAAGSEIGEDVMTISSFLEDVELTSAAFDSDEARKMSALLVGMVDRNREQVRIKRLSLAFDFQAGEQIDKNLVADIAHLVSLIEDLELRIHGFKCEDWAEMARVMSEIMHKDKDRFCIKKLKLKYLDGDNVTGKDIIRIAALIENVILDGDCFEADDLKEMSAVLSGLVGGGLQVRLSKLMLKPSLRKSKPPSLFATEIMHLVTQIEDVDLSEIRFGADDLQEMSMALSELRKQSERWVRTNKLHLSLHEIEGSGTAIGKMIPLIKDVRLYCSQLGNRVLPDMLIAMLDLLRQGSGGVRLKKLSLNGCTLNFEDCETDLMNLVALLQEVSLAGLFKGDQFHEMSVGLSRFIAEQPDMVRIKKLRFYGCDLKEKGAEIIESLSLVENVVLEKCEFKNYDLQQMGSILKKRLMNKNDLVHIKQLSLRDCYLRRKERGEQLVKLIRNLETVDLQLNDLLPADLMKIANFIEDLSGANPRSQKHRTKSLVLSVFKEIKAEHARIAFNTKELHVYPSQVAMKLVKEIVELSTEYGLQGRKCRLKMLKVVATENEPLTQELVNLAIEIGVIISGLDKKQCEWCHVMDWIDNSNSDDLSGGCKFIINGISEEVQEINDGYVSLCVSKELTEDINWKVSRGSCHIDLAIGEAVLSDVISIGPEGKSFDKAATLKIPYSIYEVPELTEVLCEYLDLESNKWERVSAVFTRDDNGIRYATVNIHVATKYMISLRLKKHIARIRQRETTISLFGGRQDIDVSFFAGTFGDEIQDCFLKVNRFNTQALQQLKRLGFTISPMLQFEMVGAQPKKPIKVKLPVENVSSNPEQLVILCWNGTELTDVTWEMKPKLVDNAVLCEINQACSILAILLETHDQRRGEMSRDILKYMQPQLEMRFCLYVKDIHDPDYCIACSRVEDRSIVDDKLRPMGYEMIADCPAINGVFEDTDMRIGIEGGVVEKNSRSPLKLRLKDGKCCFTDKFHLKQSADADNSCTTFTNDSNGIKYGSLSFTWPLVKDPASIATVQPINELKHARFLGMRLENCFLEELKFHDDTVFNNLRSLGLRKKQTQHIRSMLRRQDDSMEGNFMVEKVAWKEITDAFVKGQLDEDRFENFGKLDPQRMREKLLEVLGFLRKPWQEGDETQSKCLAKLSECKIFEQNDITTVFGRCLGLIQREIDAIEKETKLACLQDQFIITRGNHCCKLMLELAMKKQRGRNNMLEIVKSLLKTKLHFRTFKPETRKDSLVQMVLDSLGKVIENRIVKKDHE